MLGVYIFVQMLEGHPNLAVTKPKPEINLPPPPNPTVIWSGAVP